MIYRFFSKKLSFISFYYFFYYLCSRIVRNKSIFIKNMKKFLLIFLFSGIFSIGAAFAQLPSVTLKTMDGKTVNTDTLKNDGKPFIIDFFATWCKPCNRELDAISEVYDEWKEDTGVKIFAVSIDQGQNRAWQSISHRFVPSGITTTGCELGYAMR